MRKLLSLLALTAVMFGSMSLAAAADQKDQNRDPEAVFKRLDADKDGFLSEKEFLAKREGDAATKAKEVFARLDKDKDGKVTLEEFKARGKKAK